MSLGLLSKARVGFWIAAYNWLKIRRPITVQILVTKNCNMNCKMCFVYPADKQEKIRKSKEPSLKELRGLIDQACRLGAQVIIPFGGEPLLRNDIKEIIRAIIDRKRYCLLYTNGTFVEEKIDEIRDVDQLCISIDGDEETNDRIRGKGAYNKAIRALEAALKHGITCRIHTALITDTLHSLSHMCELSRKYNVMINYGSCDVTALTERMGKLFSPNRKDIISFLYEYLKWKQKGILIASPESTIRECIRIMKQWPIDGGLLSKADARKYVRLKIPPCSLSFSNIYIDSDGATYPCLPLWGKDPNSPNVYDIGLKRAWQHYAELDCHQCASIFTIEKSLFYSFRMNSLLDYVSGYQFLISARSRHSKRVMTLNPIPGNPNSN